MKTDFAAILSMLRRENNLSQKKAADELGISQALLSHYENGIREPKMEFIIKACRYYGVSTDYILGRTVEKSYDGKITLSCSEASQKYAGAASLLIAILADIGDDQLKAGAATYIGYSIYRVISALCASDDCYEPLFDAAMKTAEADLLRQLRRLKADPALKAELSNEALMKKYPEQYDALAQLEEDIKNVFAGLTNLTPKSSPEVNKT